MVKEINLNYIVRPKRELLVRLLEMETSRLTDSLLERLLFTANFLLTLFFVYVTIRHTER